MVLKKCYAPVGFLKNCVINDRMSVSVFVFRHSPITKSFVFKFNWIRLKNCAIHLWKIKETLRYVSNIKLEFKWGVKNGETSTVCRCQ